MLGNLLEKSSAFCATNTAVLRAISLYTDAIAPSGYFIDFVRCFKCGGVQGTKMTQKEIDLYREVYDSMYAGIAQLKPGNTTADVVKQFPHYDDDEYTTVTLQQFAHSIGLTLYEGMWMSRAKRSSGPFNASIRGAASCCSRSTSLSRGHATAIIARACRDRSAARPAGLETAVQLSPVAAASCL